VNSDDIRQVDFLTENMNRMEKMFPVLLGGDIYSKRILPEGGKK
jgi:hypothetical protein